MPTPRQPFQARLVTLLREQCNYTRSRFSPNVTDDEVREIVLEQVAEQVAYWRRTVHNGLGLWPANEPQTERPQIPITTCKHNVNAASCAECYYEK